MPICHLFLFFSFSFPSCVRLWKVTFFLWIQFFILLFYQFFPIFFVVWYRKCSESVIWTTFLCLVWKWIFIETVHFSTSANCYETTFLFYQIFSRNFCEIDRENCLKHLLWHLRLSAVFVVWFESEYQLKSI
jgi:hypothetical protein